MNHPSSALCENIYATFAAWPACVTPFTTSKGFWKQYLSIASPMGPCLSETYLRWKKSLAFKHQYNFNVFIFLDVLPYISVLSRTVAIIGALQPGWHTISTTLFIPHLVSPAQRDSRCKTNVCSHVNNPSFLCGFDRLWRATSENRTLPFCGMICFISTF